MPKNHWYFVKEDTLIMTEAILIIARKDLPDEIAYTIIKTICTHPDRIRAVSNVYRDFRPETTFQVTGGPVHPGAMRYFREKGYVI